MTRSRRRLAINTEQLNLITYTNKFSPLSEQYRAIRTNLQYACENDNIKDIVFTSSMTGDGKSTTISNLAVVFADSGYKTLLVDADLRKPTIAKTFGLRNDFGFSDLLQDTSVSIKDVIQKVGIEHLSVMVSGYQPNNPAELLASKRCLKIMTELRSKYDVILYDMPPVTIVTDAAILASKADGTVLVVRDRQSEKVSIRQAKTILEQSNVNLLGVVYNGVAQHKKNQYYYYQ